MILINYINTIFELNDKNNINTYHDSNSFQINYVVLVNNTNFNDPFDIRKIQYNNRMPQLYNSPGDNNGLELYIFSENIIENVNHLTNKNNIIYSFNLTKLSINNIFKNNNNASVEKYKLAYDQNGICLEFEDLNNGELYNSDIQHMKLTQFDINNIRHLRILKATPLDHNYFNMSHENYNRMMYTIQHMKEKLIEHNAIINLNNNSILTKGWGHKYLLH